MKTLTKDKLPNANKWCHIYTDIDGVTNIHNTKTKETYRIIPEISALGFHLERHKDGELQTRNTISFDELKMITNLGVEAAFTEMDKNEDTPKSTGWFDEAIELAESFDKREIKEKIEIKIPKGYMNCGVTLDNHFIADTNDSFNWDTLKFPLPKGKWCIHSYKENNTVVLMQENI